MPQPVDDLNEKYSHAVVETVIEYGVGFEKPDGSVLILSHRTTRKSIAEERARDFNADPTDSRIWHVYERTVTATEWRR